MTAGHGDPLGFDDCQPPCTMQALIMTSCLWHLQYLYLLSASIPSHVCYPVSGILSSILFMDEMNRMDGLSLLKTILNACPSMKYSWEPQKMLEPPLCFYSSCVLKMYLSMGAGNWSPSLILSRMRLYQLKASKFCYWQKWVTFSGKLAHPSKACSLQHVVLGHELTWWGYWMWVYIHVGLGDAFLID